MTERSEGVNPAKFEENHRLLGNQLYKNLVLVGLLSARGGRWFEPACLPLEGPAPPTKKPPELPGGFYFLSLS